jgi:DNA-binding NarL/FixJ family response regulator
MRGHFSETQSTGEIWVDERCLRDLAQAVAQPEPRPAGRNFTQRERDVLKGVFEGRSNKEIGAALEISESSVKAALQQLFQKAGVRTRSQLVRVALEHFAGDVLS